MPPVRPQSLAPLHIYVVRTAVWAGMYMLPSREHFIKEVRSRLIAEALGRALLSPPRPAPTAGGVAWADGCAPRRTTAATHLLLHCRGAHALPRRSCSCPAAAGRDGGDGAAALAGLPRVLQGALCRRSKRGAQVCVSTPSQAHLSPGAPQHSHASALSRLSAGARQTFLCRVAFLPARRTWSTRCSSSLPASTCPSRSPRATSSPASGALRPRPRRRGRRRRLRWAPARVRRWWRRRRRRRRLSSGAGGHASLASCGCCGGGGGGCRASEAALRSRLRHVVATPR